uniref:Endonuclease-reverse transcriptase n=1 Tax=Cacopsylla melanoneura TaxID=428564 RepID=A0A8D8M1Y3_9HEMI
MDKTEMEIFMQQFQGNLTKSLKEELTLSLKQEVTQSLCTHITEQIAPLVGRVNKVEVTVSDHEKRISELEEKVMEEKSRNMDEKLSNDTEKRKRNLVVFNLEEENNEDYEKLERKIITVIKTNMKVNCNPQDIDYVSRLGKEMNNNRPVLIRFTTLKKKLEVLKNRNNLKNSKYNIDEDFSKELREKRKLLIPEMLRLRKENKRAVLRFDKIVVLGENQTQRQEDKTDLTQRQNYEQLMDTEDMEQDKKRKRYREFNFKPKKIPNPANSTGLQPAGTQMNQVMNQNEIITTGGASVTNTINKGTSD